MTIAEEVASADKPQPRSLPLNRWPEADQVAWNAACRAAARLQRGGAASHLKPVTRDTYAWRYGYFLSFVDRHGLLVRDASAAANVTPENVNAYLVEINGRLGSVTVAHWIYALRRAAQFMAPSCDFFWLAEIGKDLALVVCPRSKFDRVVSTEVLVEAGFTLIHEAEISANLSPLGRARQVRNGLMVSMLAFHPIRRKNYAALEIGRSFVKIRDRWWIVLSASETKERRADERPINELLTPFIERYLQQHRPVLARTDNPTSGSLALRTRWRAYCRTTCGRDNRRHHVFDDRCEGKSSHVSDLRRLHRRHARWRKPLSRKRASASPGSARQQRELQPGNNPERRRKLPANRQAIRENHLNHTASNRRRPCTKALTFYSRSWQQSVDQVRFSPDSDCHSGPGPLPLWADFVAEVL